MGAPLRQSTIQTVMIGPFLDATDGVTEEVALGTANTTELSKDGGAYGAGPTLGGAHDSDGWYAVQLSATDTNTLGILMLKSMDPATHLPVWHEFEVMPADVYDALFGVSDLDVNVTSIAAGTIDNAAFDTDAIDGATLAHVTTGTADSGTTTTLVDAARTEADTDYWKGSWLVITSGNIAGQARKISGFTPGTDTITVDRPFTQAVGTNTYEIWPVDFPDEFADLIIATDGRVDANVQEWLGAAVTAGVGSRPAVDAEGISGSTAAADSLEANIGNLDAAVSGAATPAEVATALTDIGLDHLVSAAVVGADVTDNSIAARLVSSSATADWDDFVNTTDSLQAIRDRGDAAWATGGGGALTQAINFQPRIPTSIDLANTATVRIGLSLVNSVDDLPTTAEITPGTISIERKAIGGTSWSAVVTDSAMTESAGQVYFDEVFDSGTGYAEGDSIRVTFKSVSVVADANTHEICDATGIIFQTHIRETMRGTDSAATAAALATVQADTDDIQTRLPAALVSGRMSSDAVAISGSTTAADNVEANIGNLDAAVSAVETDTQNIQSRLPTLLVGGRMDSDVGAMQAGTVTAGVIATDAVDADALAADALAEINAQVVDVVRTDTVSELSSVPAANAPLHTMIQFLFTMARNRRETTSTQDRIRNDANSANIGTATLSDDGTTFVSGEYA